MILDNSREEIKIKKRQQETVIEAQEEAVDERGGAIININASK
jgi:hypothetical protein